VGGFLWVLADEGIARTDRNDQIDNWGTNAPDGIVGPHHEKEASFLTIQDIFCPVQIALRKLPPEFSGRIALANKYDFRNLDTCDFTWWLERFGQYVPAPQKLVSPTVPPGGEGTLQIELPADWRSADTLCLRACDPADRELWTWRWAVKDAATTAREALAQRPPSPAPPPLRTTGLTNLSVTAGDTGFEFDGGLLTGVRTPSGLLRLTNGPRLVGAGDRAGPPSIPELKPGGVSPAPDAFTVKQLHLDSGALRLEATSPGPFEAYAWTVHPDGLLDLEYRYRVDQPTAYHGITFNLPEDEILAWRWSGQGPERVWANRLRGTGFDSFSRKFAKLRPGVDYGYPQCPGFYAGVRLADLNTKSGALHIACYQDDTFLRVGTNDEGKPVKTSWPVGNFSILHAIPAIGNKFQQPEVLGPQSAPHPAPGVVTGKVSFWFSK
jgi:hypothetical protein